VSEKLGAELLSLTNHAAGGATPAAVAAFLREAHHRTERALEASSIDCKDSGCTGVCLVLLRPRPAEPSASFIHLI